MELNKPLPVHDQRQFMAEAEAAGVESIGPCPSHLGEAWIDIPLPDNHTNRTRVAWPRLSGKPPLQCPLVIYFSPTWPASHSRKIKEVTLDGMAWLLDLEWDKTQQDLPL